MTMKETSPRIPGIFRYILFGLGVLALLILLFINQNLAALAEMIYPGSALWTHAVLLAGETLALGWFWRGMFRGPRHLLLVDKQDPEEQKAFAKELYRRLRKNPLVKEAGIKPTGSGVQPDQAYLDECLELLKQKADEEIRRNARRVFLATALSQNGRLDALIVFISLCRLIWRVSSIYNQRPHPREIMSLYWAVASSTFLAFSIEELDIATEITVGFGEAFHAMAPAGLTASIPFAGCALQTFTASTIDGTSNCYLALRAGIITRNAYAYGARQDEKPSRAAVFREAGAQLMDMSQELVGKVASTVAGCVSGAAKNAVLNAGGKTVQTGKDIVEGIGRVGHGIGSGAEKIASGTVSGATKIATGTVDTIDRVVDTAGKIGSGAVNTAGRIVSGTVNAVQATGDGLSKVTNSTVSNAHRLAEKASSQTRALFRLPKRLLGSREPEPDAPPVAEAMKKKSTPAKRAPTRMKKAKSQKQG